MAKTRPKAAADPAALLEQARGVLESEGAVKLSALGPAAVRALLVEELVKLGFELSKAWVRRPLEAQLAHALADGAFISLKAVGSHVAGASAVEAKRAALVLVASGGAKLVLRGTDEVLVPPTFAVLSREELRRFGEVAKRVAKAASSKSGASLLRSDLVEAMERVTPGISGPAAAREARTRPATAPPPVPEKQRAQVSRLLSAVDETRDPRTGLSFVPAIFATLRPQLGPEAVRTVLLAAAMDGLLELRPEGGINRLSEAELAVCPEGPQGTRLSWARRTERVAR